MSNPDKSPGLLLADRLCHAEHQLAVAAGLDVVDDYRVTVGQTLEQLTADQTRLEHRFLLTDAVLLVLRAGASAKAPNDALHITQTAVGFARRLSKRGQKEKQHFPRWNEDEGRYNILGASGEMQLARTLSWLGQSALPADDPERPPALILLDRRDRPYAIEEPTTGMTFAFRSVVIPTQGGERLVTQGMFSRMEYQADKDPRRRFAEAAACVIKNTLPKSVVVHRFGTEILPPVLRLAVTAVAAETMPLLASYLPGARSLHHRGVESQVQTLLGASPSIPSD